MEIYRNIDTYIKYNVSNLWNIKNIITWKILKPLHNKWWYLQASLYVDGNRKHISIHRLVAIAFIPNPDNKREVNHIDGNRRNNCVDNLEWVTPKENVNHAFKYLWKTTLFNTNHPRYFAWKFGIKHMRSKKVDQFTLQWAFVMTWDSMMDIQRELLLANSTISKVCQWKIKSSWWFMWKYHI